jgi:uncharacterized membrane protein AbrB (regulator of aidB expression)
MTDLLVLGFRLIGWAVATCLGSIGVVATLACLRRPDLFWPDAVLLLGAASALTIAIGDVRQQ